MTAIQQKLSPASFAKYCEIRRRMQAFDARPTIIKPLRPMHRAVLSATLYANASR